MNPEKVLRGSFIHLKYSAGSARGCLGPTVSQDFWKIPRGKDVLVRPRAPFLVPSPWKGPRPSQHPEIQGSPEFGSFVSLTARTAVSSVLLWGRRLQRWVPHGCFESSQDGMWDGLLDSGCASLRPRPCPHGSRGRGLLVLGERGGCPDSRVGKGVDVPAAMVRSVTAPC